jgi:hypothetical protein
MRSADSPQIQRTRDTLRGAQVWSLDSRRITGHTRDSPGNCANRRCGGARARTIGRVAAKTALHQAWYRRSRKPSDGPDELDYEQAVSVRAIRSGPSLAWIVGPAEPIIERRTCARSRTWFTLQPCHTSVSCGSRYLFWLSPIRAGATASSSAAPLGAARAAARREE